MRRDKIILFLLLCSLASMTYSCINTGNVTRTLTNQKLIEFKLGMLTDFSINNIGIGNLLSSYSIGEQDSILLLNSFRSKEMTAEFNINILAKNLNDGINSGNRIDADLLRIDWRLYIKGKLTITESLKEFRTIPGDGQITLIPIHVKIDLMEHYGNLNFNELIGLMLALTDIQEGGKMIQVHIEPEITTRYGKMSYPGGLMINDREFRSG